MNIRRISAAAALIVTASFGACSETKDPAGGGDDAVDGTVLPDTQPDVDVSETDDTEDTVDLEDTGDSEDTADTSDSEDAVDTEDGVDADDAEDSEDTADTDDPDATTPECPVECTDGCGEFSDASCSEDSLAFDYIGQMFDGTCGAAIPDGGCATTTAPPAFDANIDELLAQNTSTGDEDVVVVDIDVSSAIVTATSFVSGGNPDGARRNFWIQDSNGSYQIRLSDNADLPPFDIRVGQEISFTATALVKFFDTPQIDAVDASSWVLNSEGNDVFVESGRAFAAEDVNTLAHFTGTVSAIDTSQANDGSCGGSSYCYVVSYGTDSSIVLRTASDFQPQVGDTVEFTGPLKEFAGGAQADTTNFEWVRVSNPDQ